MTFSGRSVGVAWVLGCTTLVVIAVATASTLAWLACLVTAMSTALVMMGIAQGPEKTIAEIIRDAELR